MHRASSRIAAAGSLAVAAAALLAGPGPAATSIDRPSVIRITDRELHYQRYDEGPKGAGPADVEIAWQALYNPSITTKAIGHAELLCTFLTRRSRSCTTSYFLPKGKIVVSGVIGSRLLYELPVVGGTGLYDNARGSLVVTTSATAPRREILVFRLLP